MRHPTPLSVVNAIRQINLMGEQGGLGCGKRHDWGLKDQLCQSRCVQVMMDLPYCVHVEQEHLHGGWNRHHLRDVCINRFHYIHVGLRHNRWTSVVAGILWTLLRRNITEGLSDI